MKRVWESYSLFLIPGLILMTVVIIGVWLHLHHLYHWTDAEAVEQDPILKGKSGFLNPVWYTLGTFLVVGTWIYFATQMRRLSMDEDKFGTTDYAHHRRYKVWSAIFLPIGGFTSAAMIWQWIMSIDAHWYSTLFAWYTTASWFVAMMALTIMTMIYLKSRGFYPNVTFEHLHDMGKYLFAFSIFWTYLWFSQYMLIWYANIGEETVYFHQRMNNFPVLFWGNLALNFVLPFLVLMRNDTKRKFGTLFFASLFVFFGHWWDFFQMIKPGVFLTAQEALAHMGGHAAEAATHVAESTSPEMLGHSDTASTGLEGEHVYGFVSGFTIPGLLELGTMIGFLGGFLFFTFSRLEKAPLTPVNDPYLVESEHHHV